VVTIAGVEIVAGFVELPAVPEVFDEAHHQDGGGLKGVHVHGMVWLGDAQRWQPRPGKTCDKNHKKP
jgi:hypothetical protein